MNLFGNLEGSRKIKYFQKIVYCDQIEARDELCIN